MKDYEILEVVKILSEWNPLGDLATKVPDLDGYRTEAIDIIFELSLSKNESKASIIISEVLNQAFDLSLSSSECTEAARKILSVITRKH